MSTKPKAAPVVSAINVIPMADIMLVLLIIFMVITPMFGPTVPVSMAAAENPREMKDADREDALIVAITRNGSVFLRAEQLTLGQLGARIAGATAGRPNQTVYVKSDRRAKFGSVVAVVDEIRNAGVERLGLLTEKMPETPTERRNASWQ